MDIKMVLNMAANRLKKFLQENDGAWEITVYKINEWLKENNHPFSLHTDGTNLEVKLKQQP